MSNIVIYGRGKTGQNCYKLLKKQGISSVFYDDVTPSDNLQVFTKNCTVLVSPGVYPNAKGLQFAKSVGAKIVGELQYCFNLCPSKCVSVTGTNGKTTTTQLIWHVLTKCGKSAKLLGNGGVPFSSQVLDCVADDVVVLESSSFQLAYCNSFSPYVSLFTNLAPDHLDYHGSFQDYSLAKQNNFANQQENCYAIFNADDKILMQLSFKSKARTLFYSTTNVNANCYFDGARVTLNLAGQKSNVKSNYLAKLFTHNLSNCLGAILVCALFGIPLKQSLKAIESYKFLPHRMQKVATFNNVTFIDDSKGTNVHATVSAINCVKQNFALILGGSNKGEVFDEIFLSLPSNAKCICAVGQTATAIATCGKKYGFAVKLFDDIKDAVKHCYQIVKQQGGVVLMSNACASFDKFCGYDERGRYFQQVVGELKVESQV